MKADCLRITILEDETAHAEAIMRALADAGTDAKVQVALDYLYRLSEFSNPDLSPRPFHVSPLPRG